MAKELVCYCHHNNILISIFLGGMGGVAVILLPLTAVVVGSILGSGTLCKLSRLLVLSLATRVFLWVLRFSSLCKNQHSKFQFDRTVGHNEN
jgi:hypothetical protein